MIACACHASFTYFGSSAGYPHAMCRQSSAAWHVTAMIACKEE